MATSSIFHNVILTDPKQVESFVNALEASIADPYRGTGEPIVSVVSGKDEIRRIQELRRKNREIQK